MGYYTNYSVELRGEGPIFNRLKEKAHDINASGVYHYSLEDMMNEETEAIKWYSHEEDMKELSKEWPNVLFVLSGDGEENGDLWRKYFMNGDCQHTKGKVVFEEPDYQKFHFVEEAEILAKEERKAELQEMLRKVQAELDSLG